MRKVLSFVLVLSLVLGSFGMVFAAPLSDIAGKDCEEAVNVLSELGVVTGYPDGSYKPAGIVTRAEMAVIVVSALGLSDYAVGTSKFSDMAGHWADKYVAYATSLGIIAGYPDGTFKPNATVSYDEAATMLVAALGYNADSLVGTWPANFVTKAKTLGILDGIKSGAAGANRGDIAIMAYQTLDQTIGKTNKDGDFLATAGDTMLARLGAELYDPDGSATGSAIGDAFVLDNDDVVADGVNVKEYLGAYVTAYANDDNEIIAIKEVKSVFLTGKFTALAKDGEIADDDVFKAAGTEYTVEYADNTVAGLATFENGDVDGSVSMVEDTEYTIAVKLSGAKIKDVYSIHEWEVTQDDQVTDADLAKIKAKTPTLLTSEFTLDDNDKIDTSSFELVGVASLSDIQEDDIVYVYEKGGEGDIVKIVVGSQVISGEVTKIKGTTYTIGGKDYKFADDELVLSNAIDTTPSVEDVIKADLDGFGMIYNYESTNKASNYGIVLATKNGATKYSGVLGGTTAQVKIFLADGTTPTFDVDTDEYAAFETAKVGDYTAAASATTDGSFVWAIAKGDVVKYGLNKDGKINSLEFVADSSSTSSVLDKATAVADNDEKISETGYFKGFKIASDATIFAYDGFTASKDDYGVTTLAKVLKTTVDGDAWYIKNSSNVITFLYIPGTTTSDNEVYGVLTDTEVNNSDAGHGVDLLVDGSAAFYNTDTDFSEYDAYDLYLIEFAADGTVSELDDQEGTTVETAELYKNVIDDTYSLASDVVVYVWNATDSVYEVGSTSDIDGEDVVLFDVYGDSDGAYDIVLVVTDLAL